MRDRVQTLIASNGLKHWVFAARKDPELVEFVAEKTKDEPADLSFAERVHAAISGESSICENGGRRKLLSIERGWGFCGPTGKCACAAASVSAKVSAKKKSMSAEDIARANERRAATNVARYGVVNTGQTETARAAHRAFYENPDAVGESVAKGRATMLSRHGVDNGLKLPGVDAARRTVAARLTPEARAAKIEKQRAHAKNGIFLLKAYRRLKTKFDRAGYEWLTDPETYKGIYGVSGREKFPFRCKSCSLEFKDYIYDGWMPKCPSCNPYIPSYVSGEENAVADFLSSLNLRVERPGRKLLGNHEIDIYIPDQKIAVEYCGLYWHSESQGKDRNYHLTKLLACEAIGVRLITIFSDEWNLNRSIAENRLRQITGRANERVFARQTVCVPVDHATATAFLETHHVQGAGTPASVRYGLYRDGHLLAVMTFGPLRRNNNRRHETGTWELYRFASIGSVVGGASKLLAAFVRDYDPTRIETYADRRWGNGDVYRHMGFVANGFSAPGYWYVEGYSVRHHRYSFRKDRLVKDGHDRNLSEVEIMREMGYDRIWDCGNAKFIWIK